MKRKMKFLQTPFLITVVILLVIASTSSAFAMMSPSGDNDPGETPTPRPTIAPKPPSNITVPATTESSIKISWQSSTSSNVASYDVYKSLTLVATVDKNVLSSEFGKFKNNL